MVMVVSGRPLMVLKRQTADDDAGDADGDADDDADFSVRWRMAGTGILRCQGRSSYILAPGKSVKCMVLSGFVQWSRSSKAVPRQPL